MKERTIVASFVAFLTGAVVLGTGNTDIIYVAASIALFGIGIAYAEGCEKL
ncbi:MAG: hypothetical protein LV481_00025 [Methylacidiphilales bacterium]|nr:hypothetical protein [Candidatus Methylacidiphilales bacterium]